MNTCLQELEKLLSLNLTGVYTFCDKRMNPNARNAYQSNIESTLSPSRLISEIVGILPTEVDMCDSTAKGKTLQELGLTSLSAMRIQNLIHEEMGSSCTKLSELSLERLADLTLQALQEIMDEASDIDAKQSACSEFGTSTDDAESD